MPALFPGDPSAHAVSTASPPTADPLRAAREQARAAGEPVVVLALALDTFERLVERFGAQAGEQALDGVARGVLEEAGAATLIGRTPSGVLVALLRGVRVEEARPLARRVIARVREQGLELMHRRVGLSLSIGLAHDGVEGRRSFEALLRVAQAGLDVALGAGGDRVGETDLYGLVERELALEDVPAALPRAVEPGPPRAAGAGALMAALPEQEEWEKERAFEEMRGELEQAIQDKEREHQGEVELLRRRIAKLVDQLGATETELEDLHRARMVDPGQSSVYRSVQGLSPSDAAFARKRELLEAIFEANTRLREALERGAEGPSDA